MADQNPEKKAASIDRNHHDRITYLPDSILAEILSLLPIKQSARTSILSSHWRRIWLLSSLRIDVYELLEKSTIPSNQQEEWCITTIARILAVHPGSVRFCRLRYVSWDEFGLLKVTRLLETLTLRGIQILEIYMSPDFLLPRCILRCDSLRILHIFFCKFPDTLPEGSFPNLHFLGMVQTEIGSHAISHLLSSCPITKLEMDTCNRPNHGVRIRSDSLQVLKVDNEDDLFIESCPDLAMLFLSAEVSKLVIRNTPKLKVLECVSMDLMIPLLEDSDFSRPAKVNGYVLFIYFLMRV